MARSSKRSASMPLIIRRNRALRAKKVSKRPLCQLRSEGRFKNGLANLWSRKKIAKIQHRSRTSNQMGNLDSNHRWNTDRTQNFWFKLCELLKRFVCRLLLASLDFYWLDVVPCGAQIAFHITKCLMYYTTKGWSIIWPTTFPFIKWNRRMTKKISYKKTGRKI